MANITTRAGKGAPLSWNEADANFINLNTDKLEVSNNLSDVSNPTAAKSNLGLGNVDNTSDINKPISAATQAALNGKQDALPSQTGNNGKFLGTNGTTLSWNTVDALPSQTGNNGKFLTTNGTTASWTTFSGISLTGVETLTNKTLTTPVINTNINYSGTGGTIQVNGVDKVTIGASGITAGSFAPNSIDAAAAALAFSGANQSLASNGYQKLPSGLIIQWGTAAPSTTGVAVTFPIAFPSACVSLGVAAVSDVNYALWTKHPLTKTGFTFYSSYASGTTATWIAIGY